MSRYLFGADFGTTGVKAALIDPETLEIHISDAYDYPTFHEHPQWAEQEPENWWEAFKKASKDVLQRAKATGDDIIAIGISGMGGAAVCMDEDGKPLRRTMFWMDARTEKQSKWLVENFKDDILANNGNSSFTFTVPQILWIKENCPDVLVKTKKILTISGYNNYKLTGEYSANPCETSLWCILNLKSSEWNYEFADKVGIKRDWLPRMYECTDIIGSVTATASEETGLKEGTPVVAGGHDGPSSVLGMGIMNAGEMFYTMGSGSNLAVLTDEPVIDLDMFQERHVLPNIWLFDAVMTSTGAALKWFVNNFGKEEKELAEKEGRNVFEYFTEYARSAPVGADGLIFVPYLAGEIAPIFDAKARGLFFGLTYRSDKARMVRAIMEGVCFSINDSVKLFESKGIFFDEFKVQGGPAKSDVWMQCLADITDKKVLTLEMSDASPVGDAILAGMGLGIIEDPRVITEKLIKVDKIYEPNPENREVYDKLFKVYAGIYDKHKDDFALIADL